jgi:hypothetical protein
VFTIPLDEIEPNWSLTGWVDITIPPIAIRLLQETAPRMPASSRWSLSAFGLFGAGLTLTLFGCDGPGRSVDARPKVAVSGTLLVDGKPVTASGISVVLAPSDNAPPITLPVKEDGTFSGEAIAGPNYVMISAAMTADAGHDGGPRLGIGPVFLGPQSPLMVTVTEGANLPIEVGVAEAKKLKPRPTGGPQGAH